jgi:hypothetical protein
LRSATKPSPTPRASRARISGWIPVCVLLTALAALFLYIGTLPTQRIGDGAEYQCMSENWTRNFTPWLPMDFRQSCAPGIAGFIERGSQADPVHFWLLPLLSAPFWAIFHSISAYTALHWAMLSAALVYTWRRIGFTGSLLMGVLLLSSPLIWWSNKAHAEIFLCTCLWIAFVDVGVRRWQWAALWLALASTQQSTFAVFSVACLTVWFIEGRSRGRIGRREIALPLLAICLLALPGVYTWSRYGVFSTFVFTNSVDSSLVSIDRVISLFVDPDIGLLPHWPLALVGLVAVFFAPRPVAAFTLAFLILEPFLVSTQRNWNSGGTVHISRYGLYFIPPLAACIAAAVGHQRHKRPIAAVLLVLVGIFGFTWNWPRFRPDTLETYLIHTELADWLYRQHPDWYDPIPEIFIERTGIGEGTLLSAETWAVGVPSCMKLLLVKPVSELPRLPGKPPNPPGCLLPNEADLFYRDLLSGTLKPDVKSYINVK